MSEREREGERGGRREGEGEEKRRERTNKREVKKIKVKIKSIPLTCTIIKNKSLLQHNVNRLEVINTPIM